MITFRASSGLGVGSVLALGFVLTVLGACSASDDGGTRLNPSGSGATSNGGTTGNGAGGGILPEGGTGAGISLGGEDGGGAGGQTGGNPDNPETCVEAAKAKSYVGCDFWPTVSYNPVYEKNFKFAAVVANGGLTDAVVTVTRGTTEVAKVTVKAGGLEAVELPWVMELKGPTFDAGTQQGRVKTSVRVDGGAYHLVSSVPVTVWQFNPLNYEAPVAECQYSQTFGPDRCASVSNDAALLLPSTAMTGNYRVIGRSEKNGGDSYGSTSSAMVLTGTADGTTVKVQVAGDIAAGTGVTAAKKGDTVELKLNAGDVVQLLGAYGEFWESPHGDVSGSVVNADKPVQVISLNPLTSVPDSGSGYADHLEEIVLPAEVLGKHYLVASPSSPGCGASTSAAKGHLVRLFGNFDGTTLTYKGTKPSGAPDTLKAGEVVELPFVTEAFEVIGDKSFAIASIMLGTQKVGCTSGSDQLGDPAMSILVAPEQFRTEYTFLAPTDYIENYANVFVPDGANVTLDGAALGGASEKIGDSGYSVVRVLLTAGNGGVHVIKSDKPVGLQVMSFGHATGVYYPGGLNLKLISEPPVIVIIK